jgi:tRNA-splicing ligase RtcB (3'-phosphate/5'-hydroxy nucleic acid ligase)
MPVRTVIEGSGAPVKVWTTDLDAATRQQLANVAALPIVHGHVAAMPDVHLGIGATVGSVIATRRAIIPAAVGVDIGCGMCAARTTVTARDLDEKRLRRVYDHIVDTVPVGMAQHQTLHAGQAALQRFDAGLKRITEHHPGVLGKVGRKSRWTHQLGTLGGGNHFIEVCLDQADRVWVMLHSGSRGIGNAIGTYFTELARQDMARLQMHLPDRDLAYLQEGTRHFDDYVHAVSWAQDYARVNSELMMALVLEALRQHLPAFEVTAEAVNCHHNYVQRERHLGADVWVTRKGAIRAGQGELGIIPGSMGARSYIVRGKGNADSFESCAHGAGRRLSRRASARQFNEADLIRQTEGVVCRKDRGVIDEIPAAYKDIDQVMANQTDLVDVVHTLKQVVCVKG